MSPISIGVGRQWNGHRAQCPRGQKARRHQSAARRAPLQLRLGPSGSGRCGPGHLEIMECVQLGRRADGSLHEPLGRAGARTPHSRCCRYQQHAPLSRRSPRMRRIIRSIEMCLHRTRRTKCHSRDGERLGSRLLITARWQRPVFVIGRGVLNLKTGPCLPRHAPSAVPTPLPSPTPLPAALGSETSVPPVAALHGRGDGGMNNAGAGCEDRRLVTDCQREGIGDILAPAAPGPAIRPSA